MPNENLPQLVHRVWSEYRELPGMKLTLLQARRLLDVEEKTCTRVVSSLAHAGHVSVDGSVVVRGEPGAGDGAFKRAAGSPDAVAVAPPPRVLVIEDDPTQLDGLTAALRAAGFDVAGAPDAARGTAVALLEPDVILLDIGLPDSDGHSVAACLRAHGVTSAIPLVFLSARGGPDDRARAEAVGAAAYLVKPCRASEVAAVIRRIVDSRTAARTTA